MAIGRVVIRPYGGGGTSTTTTTTTTSFDTDAQAFITATALTDTTQKNAINDLVLDLKSAGIWTKMRALYPMVGGTATTHKFNLKDPRDLDAAYRLVFSGGWTHTSTGALPNGTTGYADTNLIPSTSGIGLNSTHMSYYSRTNYDGAGIDFGAISNPGNNGSIYANLKISNAVYFRVNTNNVTQTESSVSVSDSRKFYMVNRISSTVETTFINGTANNVTKSSNVQPTVKFYLGSANLNNVASYFGQRQCAFSSIGDGLTDLESTLFYQIVEKYQYALGRNVNANQTFYFNRNYSNETNTFIVNGSISNATQISAVDTLVNDLKAAGIWTKMKALYPMVGGTALAHKFNLVNPVDTDAAFRLTFYGGTHGANGYSNSVGGYVDTYLVAQSNFTNANISLSIYSKTQIIQNSGHRTEIGAYDGTNFVGMSQQYDGFGKYFSAGPNNASYQLPVPNTISSTVTTGLQIGNRLDNVMKVFQNGVQLASKTVTNSSLTSNSFYIGAYHSGTTLQQGDYSQRQIAFASIGNGLTDLESNIFYQIVEKFQYTLGRNSNTNQTFYYNSSYTNEQNLYLSKLGETSITNLPTISGIVFAYDAKYYTSGTTLSDLSINGINATLQNGVSYVASNSGYFNLDAVDDRILVNSTTNYVNAFSTSVWFYSKATTLTNPVRPIITKSAYWAPMTYDFPFGLYLATNGTYVNAHISNGSAYSISAPSNGQIVTANVDVNAWNNVVVTYDKVNLKIYVNGVLVQSNPCSITLATNNQYWSIGRASQDYSGGSSIFDGRISQAILYSRAINSTEALQNYNAIKSRYGL